MSIRLNGAVRGRFATSVAARKLPHAATLNLTRMILERRSRVAQKVRPAYATGTRIATAVGPGL